VERQLFLLCQQQDGGSRELLADRSDAVTHLGRGGSGGLDPRLTVRLQICDPALADDRDRRTRCAGALEDLCGGLVDGGADGGGQFDARGGRRLRSQTRQKRRARGHERRGEGEATATATSS